MTLKYIILIAFFVALFNIGLARDARLSGMGNLEFIFQDEFNQLNLYDFAKMPAGFLEDDTFSVYSLTISGLKQRWEQDSIMYWALGQAFPEKLQDYAPFEALGIVGFEDIPQFALHPCQMRYESRRLYEEYGDFGEVLKPQAWGVYGSYSQLSREYLNTQTSDIVQTPEFYIVYAKPILPDMVFGIQGDGFYGTYRSANKEEKATLTPFGGSMGLSYKDGALTLGLNGEYHYPMFNFTYTSFGDEYNQKFSGHAISPSIAGIIDLDNLIWANVLSYKWVSLSGTQHGSDGDSELGDLQMNDYVVKSQVLYCFNIFRFTMLGEFDAKTPVFTDNNGITEFKTSFKNYTGVVGAGIDLPKLQAGIEGQYIYIRADEKIQEISMTGNDLTFRIGGEFSVTRDFLLRCGYNYNRIDPDLDISDDRVLANLVACGLGVNFVDKLTLDLAYNYEWTTFENNTDEKVIDHVLLFNLRYIMR